MAIVRQGEATPYWFMLIHYTWHCIGTDENIHSDAKVEYLQDGSFRGDAILKIDDDGNILAYRVVGSGKWRFENNACA
ncbi:hypothetical protein [Neisseria meningitidis]|nr:hypothetical protein [Neisseria meningitidis]